jgi:TPR repeat protein
MKRALVAVFCAAALIANCVAYAADPVSDKEVADRYQQAAQSGDNDAQFYLGALYSAGVGRPRSDQEAFRWFSRAAEQGHSHAMLVLAGIYAIGRGTPKDNLSAYKWAYIVSAGSRVEEFRNGSRQLMGVLETRMTPDEIGRAKAAAGSWRAAPSQARRDTPPPPSLAASRPSPPTTSGYSADAGSPQGARGSSGKKDDVDSLIDRVPSELRKRFGF